MNNKIEDVKQRQKQEAKNLTLLKAPLKTSYYFFFGVIPELIQHSVDFIKRHKRAFSIALLTVVLFTLSLAIETPLKSVCKFTAFFQLDILRMIRHLLVYGHN